MRTHRRSWVEPLPITRYKQLLVRQGDQPYYPAHLYGTFWMNCWVSTESEFKEGCPDILQIKISQEPNRPIELKRASCAAADASWSPFQLQKQAVHLHPEDKAIGVPALFPSGL